MPKLAPKNAAVLLQAADLLERYRATITKLVQLDRMHFLPEVASGNAQQELLSAGHACDVLKALAERWEGRMNRAQAAFNTGRLLTLLRVVAANEFDHHDHEFDRLVGDSVAKEAQALLDWIEADQTARKEELAAATAEQARVVAQMHKIPEVGVPLIVEPRLGARILGLGRDDGELSLWALVNPDELALEHRVAFALEAGKAAPYELVWWNLVGATVWYEASSPDEQLAVIISEDDHPPGKLLHVWVTDPLSREQAEETVERFRG